MPPMSSRDEILKHVILRAVTSPVSLFLGTSGLLLVAGQVTWPFGLVALAAEIGWVWSRIRDPGYAQASSEEVIRQRWRDLVNRLEEMAAVLDRETSATLASIVEAQERLLGIYNSGTSPVLHTRVQMASLLQHCLSLAEKRHRLQSYIHSFRAQDVQRQAAQLQVRVEKTEDGVTRQLYERALEQKRQELENYVRLEDAVARIDGQLAAVQCTFDNLLSKIVCVQSVPVVAHDATSDPVLSELNQLANGVAALEASLNESLTLRGAA